MYWMGSTGWFTPMASPIQGRLTLFRVRKALGVSSLLRELSASACQSSACRCCFCFRQQQRWGDSASLLSSHLQQRWGPAVPSHGSEACALQWGDVAGQQAGAAGGDQEADHAAGGSVGGKHAASWRFNNNNKRERMVSYYMLLLSPSRRSC